MIRAYRIGLVIPTTKWTTVPNEPVITYEWLPLNDGIQYDNAIMAPTITIPQRSLLGSGGPYEAVEQSIEVDILGDTPGRCWENLNTLIKWLHQSDRWYRSEPREKVVRLYIQTTPNAPMVFADILGFIDQQAPSIPVEYESQLGPRYALRGVSITVLRFGVWEEESKQNIRTTNFNVPNIYDISFNAGSPANAGVYSRLGIRIMGQYDWKNQAYLALVSDPKRMMIIDSVDFDDFGSGTNTTDTITTNPYGGSFRRYLSDAQIRLQLDTDVFMAAERIAVFAYVRNNSASVEWQLSIEGNERVTIPVNTTGDATGEPTIVMVGILDRDYIINGSLVPGSTIYMPSLQIRKLSSTSATFDIDYLMLVALDDPWADTIIRIQGHSTTDIASQPGASNILINAGVDYVYGAFDYQKRPYPMVLTSQDDLDYFPGNTIINARYQGNSHIVAKGNTFYMALMPQFHGIKEQGVGVPPPMATVWRPSYRRWLIASCSPGYLLPPGS
jgi:hypothetical protein